MLTDLYPWLAPILLAASAWLVLKALGLQEYLRQWALALDPGEDES